MPLLERARVEAYGTTLVRTSDLFFAAKTIKETGDQEYALACRESILNQGGKVVEFPTLPVQVQPVDKQSKLVNAIGT